MVLILSILSAIMIQYPQYFYTMTPGVAEPSLKAAKSIVIPLVITIVVWLTAKLALSKRVQVLAKVVAWMIVIGVTSVNFGLYVVGLMYASGVQFRGIVNDIYIGSGQITFFLLSPLFTYFLVLPKYSEIYPESSLLKSKTKFIITSAVTQALLFVLEVILVS